MYFIIEQQSSIDRTMPYRIFEYVTEVIREDVKNKQNRIEKYPTVIPIVINTALRKWNVAQSYSEKAEQIKGINKTYFNISYEIVDINNYTLEELYEKGNMIAYLMMIEKAENKEQYEETLNKIIEKIKQEDAEKMIRLVKYVLGQTLEQEKVKKIISKLNKKMGDDIMPSALQRIILQERKEERIECKIAIIKNMLKNKIDVKEIAKLTGIPEKEVRKCAMNK